MHTYIHHHKTNKLFQFFIGITFLFCSASKSFAQLTDTLSTTGTEKSVTKSVPVKSHSPKKAAWMSAVLPGLGQVYNKRYWKVPVIYAGFVGLTYAFQFNQTKYVKYRDAYKFRIDDDASTVDDYVGIYSNDNLSALYQYYHRYRDLSVIGGAALYLLQIVDASVDAHLFTFNVSDDLSMHVHPTMMNIAGVNKTGIGVSIKF